MRYLVLGAAISLMASSAMADVPTDNPQTSALDKSVQAAADAFFADTCHAGLSLAITATVEIVRHVANRRARPADLIDPKPSADFEEMPNSTAVRAGSGG